MVERDVLLLQFSLWGLHGYWQLIILQSIRESFLQEILFIVSESFAASHFDLRQCLQNKEYDGLKNCFVNFTFSPLCDELYELFSLGVSQSCEFIFSVYPDVFACYCLLPYLAEIKSKCVLRCLAFNTSDGGTLEFNCLWNL